MKICMIRILSQIKSTEQSPMVYYFKNVWKFKKKGHKIVKRNFGYINEVLSP